MHPLVRKAFPFVVIAGALMAIIWAVSFGTLPEAEFTFNNGTEVQTIDPPRATGAPEGRIISALFEGLYRTEPIGIEFDEQGSIATWPEPEADGNVATHPAPAVAESCEITDDGKTYTFTIRGGVQWSDGSPVTAHDFRWSWMRMLHPETASQYAYQLYYVVGGKPFNSGRVAIGDRVEVEMGDRADEVQTFPRGTMRHGVLRHIAKPPEPDVQGMQDDEKKDIESEWRKRWVYYVEVKPRRDGRVDWDAAGKLAAFSKQKGLTDLSNHAPRPADFRGSVEHCMAVLVDFDSNVGIHAPDDKTLVVELNNRTPFFLDLVAFYPLFPVNRACVEKYGWPDWTKAENIVSNGPFQLEFRRIRDRIRLVKNPRYWNEKIVKLNIIDALAIEAESTGLNVYLNGQCDWATTVPNALIPELRERDDFYSAPMLTTYFYRLNVTRPPLDDVHVRRALNMAIDKRLICEKVTRGGQMPARSFVPPGLTGYRAQPGDEFDPEAARAELAKSKYARQGKLPKIELVYNTQGSHGDIAEVLQQQWKNNLGVDVGLGQMEWGSFLDTVHQLQYDIARAGWIGDYPDPNTFLDMWVTRGENNETGWSNSEYDQLIHDAAAETDADKRLRLFEQAERILMDEVPIIPIYFYMSINMVNPRVTGFYTNNQDLHPLHLLRVEAK